MKKRIFYTVLFVWLLFDYGEAFAPNMWPDYNYVAIQKELKERYICDQELLYHKNLQRFKTELAFRESGNNWKEYNPYGYIGKFQFGKAALEVTGYGHVDFVSFMNNPSVFPEKEQEKAMDSLLNINERLLSPYLENHIGEVMLDSVEITRSGLLAAAHLAGPNNVIRFLKTKGKHNPKDQMGTRLSDYLTTFAARFQQ